VYAQDGSQGAQQLTWVDRSGRTLETIGEVAYSTGLADGRRVALSPDGKRVAVATGTDNQDIWIIDLSRGVRSRLTVEPGPDRAPVWSPDGTRIAFATQRSGRNSLRQKIVNSTAADEVLLDGGSSLVPTDWSSDGRFLVYSVGGSFPRRADIWILPLVGDRKPFPIVNTAAVESSAVISPGTRCLAYTSDEAGGPNVYLQPFPTGGTRVQVSRGGGIQAMWRADGKELFYIRPDGMMMAAQVVVPPVCDTGAAQPLFPAISPSALNLVTTQYAVDRAGQRFLLHARPRQSSAPTLTVVLHWPGLVKP